MHCPRDIYDMKRSDLNLKLFIYSL